MERTPPPFFRQGPSANLRLGVFALMSLALLVIDSRLDVLATLRRAGPPHRLSPGQLAASMMLTTGGMTGRLDRLEHAGHVRRSPDPSDRRALLVSLTDSGRALVDEAVAAGLATQQALLADLSPSDLARANDVLRRVLSSVEGHAAP